MPGIDDWAFWLYLAAWLPYTAFVLIYGFRSPWWRNAVGRSLMLSKVVIVAFLTHVMIAVAIGPYPGQGIARVFVLGGAIVAGSYQLATLLRLQHDARHFSKPGRDRRTGKDRRLDS